MVTESEFISIFANQLKNAIGLSDQEIIDLADYFRIQDGRILYTQLCDVIHTKGITLKIKLNKFNFGIKTKVT